MLLLISAQVKNEANDLCLTFSHGRKLEVILERCVPGRQRKGGSQVRRIELFDFGGKRNVEPSNQILFPAFLLISVCTLCRRGHLTVQPLQKMFSLYFSDVHYSGILLVHILHFFTYGTCMPKLLKLVPFRALRILKLLCIQLDNPAP